ncbi:NAD(P)-binding protein [Coniochaeta ligniaria NRRL 30616]|uniref:NAD(P)-binding protein n=1 Tax=Coniochaeta ligniaria NRRL 30616 TaxID=1408157 RepID=A0A1J7K1X5_9PEZI|nr:NAD(P)-binding protein [Coniochaeta ligniaria NRRL 30616]
MLPKPSFLGGLLTGRVSIVTGASSGLGRAIALAFMQQGATVVCADRQESSQQLQQTHKLVNTRQGNCIFIQTDVSDQASMKELVQAAVDRFGRIDIMVNNAGVAPEASNPLPVWQTPESVFDSTWNVNARGVFLGCKYAGEQMLQQEQKPEYGRAGTIINMGSVLGVLGKPGTPAYAAAKGAVIAMTRAVAMDYAPHAIHCNSILPGFVRTPMISAMTDDSDVAQHLADNHPLKRLVEPEEVADAAVFLASSLSNGVTGLNMSVDGGLHSKVGL